MATNPRVVQLAAQIATLVQANKILAVADKVLQAAYDTTNLTPLVASAAGLRQALRDSVAGVRGYVVKLQTLAKVQKEPLTQNFREQVALASIQANDVLKQVDEAVTDPNLKFARNFSEALGTILSTAGAAVKAVASTATDALTPTLPLLVPVALAVGLGYFMLKSRRTA